MKEETNNGDQSFMSGQVAEAYRSGINPMMCFRTAVNASEQSRHNVVEEDFIAEVTRQLLAVTKFVWGNRMGLVELTKRQEIQRRFPNIAKPVLFAETQPAFFKATYDETCPHT